MAAISQTIHPASTALGPQPLSGQAEQLLEGKFRLFRLLVTNANHEVASEFLDVHLGTLEDSALKIHLAARCARFAVSHARKVLEEGKSVQADWRMNNPPRQELLAPWIREANRYMDVAKQALTQMNQFARQNAALRALANGHYLSCLQERAPLATELRQLWEKVPLSLKHEDLDCTYSCLEPVPRNSSSPAIVVSTPDLDITAPNLTMKACATPSYSGSYVPARIADPHPSIQTTFEENGIWVEFSQSPDGNWIRIRASCTDGVSSYSNISDGRAGGSDPRRGATKQIGFSGQLSQLSLEQREEIVSLLSMIPKGSHRRELDPLSSIERELLRTFKYRASNEYPFGNYTSDYNSFIQMLMWLIQTDFV